MKPLTIVLTALILGTQYALWVGDKNVFDLIRLNRSIEQHETENKTLLNRNQKLVAEVNDLKQGGETMETIARMELGLIKQGETFFQIIQDVDQ